MSMRNDLVRAPKLMSSPTGDSESGETRDKEQVVCKEVDWNYNSKNNQTEGSFSPLSFVCGVVYLFKVFQLTLGYCVRHRRLK